MKKLIVLGLALLSLAVCGTVWAQENHLSKKNAIAVKAGWHFYGDSDFIDYWDTDKEDMNGIAFELAYERRVNSRWGIEVSVGKAKGDESWGAENFEIDNWYFSPSLKIYKPVNNDLILYAGAGPDIYRTKLDYNGSFGMDDTFYSFGCHGLVGAEWFIMKNSEALGYNDAPVSLLFEYKYSWVRVGAADEKMVSAVNTVFGTTLPSHDLDVGGHMIFAGLRWHF